MAEKSVWFTPATREHGSGAKIEDVRSEQRDIFAHQRNRSAGTGETSAD